MTDDFRDYVNSLPEASGTFEGTYDPGVVNGLFDVPDLMPVEVDAGDEPLPPGIAFMTGLTIRSGERSWTLPVDHVELFPGSNRAVIWVRRAREES